MQHTARPRIAFLAAGFIQWTGGLDFLRLCVGGIDSVLPGITWSVLVPDDTVSKRALALVVATKRRIFSLAGVQPAVTPPVTEDHLRDAISTTGCSIETHNYYGSLRGLSRALSNLDAQVVLPSMMSLGPHFPHQWIGYIADLQHKRLPGNFSRRECQERERNFSALLSDARALIVNSRSVVRDIEEFYPRSKATLFSLPFCPSANPTPLDDIDEDVLRPYALPEKFFIISNQFWVHKSHQTAFDALRLVKDAGFSDVHILCTGNLHDYRAPGYVDKLKDGIACNGLTDRIHFLGMIPKRHQLAVMRRSVAVVQPTLFEGGPGGGALYDGVSTATPVILSDIDVNREADLGVIEFFRAGSAEDLAQKMVAALRNPPQRLSTETTLSMLRQRQRQMGETLLQVISFVMGSSASTESNNSQGIQHTPVGL
ncbi:MAG: glycosyltransferase [Terriglobales bacterium]|jgi:glycosyltransferase involved in cell wall biosynthesis